jgi:recombination protein RecA
MTAKKQAKKGAKTKPAKIDMTEFDEMLGQIEKERGNVVTVASKIPAANHIPTGSFMLDYALLGGIPEGYATMLYGYESCGKTFMAKKAVASYQRKHPDKQVVWIDAEGMFDKDWAEALGCDLSRLHVARPTTGNEAVDMISALMEPLEVGMVILDSIPGCVPNRIAEKSAEDKTMGELAALMGIMCSKIYISWATERRRNHWVTTLLINQFRMKLGLVFGDNRTLPGGRQINHLPTTKIELKNNEISGKDSYDSQCMVRNEHSFKLTKAKHGRSVREGEFHVSLSGEVNGGVDVFGFINHKAVVVYSKRMGLLTGGAGKYRLTTIPDRTFRTYDDISKYLVENERVMVLTQQVLIQMQRVDKGLTPKPQDGYLVAPEPEAKKREVKSLKRGRRVCR